MRVISLEADNFKRLRAISITPTQDVIEVTGDNGEGKTSSLDAIWAALAGKDACPAKPIHTGAEKAEIRVVLGEGGEPRYKVTRTFKLREGVPHTTDLKVESADGGRFDKPQNLLNTLLGEFCFDPLAFISLPDKDQITSLRKFVPGVDFEAIERLNRKDFEERTEINRDTKQLRTRAEALPAIPESMPERADVDALQKTLAEAAEHNTMVEQRRLRREATTRRLQDIESEIERLEEEKAELEKKQAEAPPLPEPIDVQDASAKLSVGRERNALLDRIAERQALETAATQGEAKALALTTAMDKRKADAAAAVQAAKMPIAGLGFGDGFVTLNGEPLSQASKAQQIRASLAIATAMSPKLRVARIADGSLLDRKSWAAVEAYARENDLQVWVETVTAHTAAAIVIEDGGIASVGQTKAADVGDVL